MTPAEILGLAAIGGGLAFFAAGSVGLLRFPDAATRLHALTKADTLGLGLVALGAGLHLDAWQAWLRLGLIWAFVLLASATASHLIARHVLRGRQERP